MNDKDPQNLFDAASESLRKKKKAKKMAEGTYKEKNVPPENVSTTSDKELDTMFTRLRNIDHDLQKRMEYIAQLSGMTPSQVEDYIANPDNFPAKDWSKMQQKKQALEQKLYSSIGIKYQKRIVKKKSKKMQKGRRGKTLGARKGWIQM